MATMQLIARSQAERPSAEQSLVVVDHGDGRPPERSRAISGRAGLVLCLLGVLGAAAYSLVPARILDTRDGTGGIAGARAAGSTVDVQITGQGGVPLLLPLL